MYVFISFYLPEHLLIHEQNKTGQLINKLPHNFSQRMSYTQQLEEHGCYIKEDIGINLTWTFQDITNKVVRILFRKVFEYVDSVRNEESSHPDWQLLSLSNGKFGLCPVTLPTGTTLHQCKGRGKAGVAESSLWFGNLQRVTTI